MEREVCSALAQAQSYLELTEVVEKLVQLIEQSAKTSNSQQSIISSLTRALQSQQQDNECSCFISGSFHSGTSEEKVVLDFVPEKSFKCPLCMYETEKRKSLSKHLVGVHHKM